VDKFCWEEAQMTDNSFKYWKFAVMIAVSMAVMFGLTYLNTYEASHVFWSETRFYMTFLMGTAMAVIMLGFMLNMYRKSAVNKGIFLTSIVVFAVALWLVRSQVAVQDCSYMKAMIPHHSIAILTSERAGMDDIRVRELANGIIDVQRREIKEMEWLIHDIEKNGKAVTQMEAAARPVPDFEGSL
tara:strand:+ start:156 stop:710 length:555 start_codon:yes stop_codon:yes gene_type:complete